MIRFSFIEQKEFRQAKQESVLSSLPRKTTSCSRWNVFLRQWVVYEIFVILVESDENEWPSPRVLPRVRRRWSLLGSRLLHPREVQLLFYPRGPAIWGRQLGGTFGGGRDGQGGRQECINTEGALHRAAEARVFLWHTTVASSTRTWLNSSFFSSHVLKNVIYQFNTKLWAWTHRIQGLRTSCIP